MLELSSCDGGRLTEIRGVCYSQKSEVSRLETEGRVVSCGLVANDYELLATDNRTTNNRPA